MNNEPLTAADFLESVANHKMTVFRDDGVNRHLRFAQPGTSNRYFDILTWPGHLCYTGDMGTFMFRRLEDMFEFFRKPPKREPFKMDKNYWEEKVIAMDRHGGTKEWSQRKFHDTVIHDLESYCESRGLGQPEQDAIEAELKDQVMFRYDQHESLAAVEQFEFNGFSFQDFWDHDCRDYTHHFVWCCFALEWAIEQYDQSKGVT